jgi:hypothetical protein
VSVQEATAQGWVLGTSCDPKLGIRATQDSNFPTRRKPVALYFSASGQLSGYAVEIYGPVASMAGSAGFYEKITTDQYRLKIGFRSRDVCKVGHVILYFHFVKTCFCFTDQQRVFRPRGRCVVCCQQQRSTRLSDSAHRLIGN